MFGRLPFSKGIAVGLLIFSVITIFWNIILSTRMKPEHVQFQHINKANLSWAKISEVMTRIQPEDMEIIVNKINSTPTLDEALVRNKSEIWLQIADMNKTLDFWLNEENISHDDPLLVEYVRHAYLIPPPDKSLPYNLLSRISNPSEGQIQAVWDILKDVKDGFFIDCGANDGEYISNTLWLEKEKGWNGILIEADPTTFSILRTKHRRAWHANLCLSPQITPELASFFQNPEDIGKNGLFKREEHNVTLGIKVQCIPLYTILLGLKRNVVDFFSLDIEGYELEVLKTIPFDKIFIKTLAVEHWTIPEGADGLKKFMVQLNYTLHKTVEAVMSWDSIFVHNSLLPIGFRGNRI